MNRCDPAVQSPCIRRCCLNDDDICMGCFRSLAEITAWGQASDALKLEILHKTTQRRSSHEERYDKQEF